MEIASYLPVFNGFYSTLFECDREEEEILSYNEENDTDLKWDDFNWSYYDYHKRVAERCVDEIERELKDLFNVELEFAGLISPREYNFSNDSINVNYYLENADFDKLIQYLKDNTDAFAEYLEDRYKSRSGFVSFFEYDVKTWLDDYLLNDEKLTHCFGSVLDFYFHNEGFTDEDLSSLVADEMYINFELK